MPKFKILSWKLRYAKETDDVEADWDESDLETESYETDSEADTDWTDDELMDLEEESELNLSNSFEGDSLYTLFSEPVRLYIGRNIKTIKFMKLKVDSPKKTLPILPSPWINNILPVSYYTAMDFGWRRSHTPGFKVFKDRTFAIRDGKAGTSNAILGDVGFQRGIHKWVIRWKHNERGMHPVIGVGTAQTRLKSAICEPLVADKYAYGWHLTQCCLLHNINYHRQYPFIAYPGIEFRDENGRFNVPEEVTVVLDMEIGTLSFIAGGVFLGIAFGGLQGLKLYPMISTTWGQAKIQMIYEGGIYPRPDSLVKTASKKLPQTTLQELSESFALPTMLFENYMIDI